MIEAASIPPSYKRTYEQTMNGEGHRDSARARVCVHVCVRTMLSSKSPIHALSCHSDTRFSRPARSSRLIFNMIGILAKIMAI